jgi:hypothetical protein
MSLAAYRKLIKQRMADIGTNPSFGPYSSRHATINSQKLKIISLYSMVFPESVILFNHKTRCRKRITTPLS